MIGNYENWVFAQPVKDWRLVSFKSLYGNLNSLMEMELVTSCWNDSPRMHWRPVYQWFYQGLKQSEAQRLDIPTSPLAELSPASSID